MGFTVKKDDEEEKVDELVGMIDLLIESGSGHLTIDIEENDEGIKVKTFHSNDCGASKGACCQPTEDNEEY